MKKSAARELDEVIVPDRFADAERAFEDADKKLPNISPLQTRSPDADRRSSSVSLPHYVWELIRDESYVSRDPQNVVILRGLKALGLNIREEDLVDLRKVRP
jgi:hypothetical protein